MGNKISNELSKDFANVESRKKIIAQHANSEQAFFGENEDGEDVELHVSPEGIILKTYQSNGHVRINYYDSNGILEGESFDGRWK